MTVPDLDHTSFAVHDALAWAGRLRRELGATPIAGETLAEFRYLLLYVGDATDGARIELLEPRGVGFLSRFLERHGIGPHHITFTVPDLRAAVERVRAVGATVVGEDYEHPSWQEAFIAPDGIHGVVIQLARPDSDYPGPAELLASTDREPAQFPSSRGATDPLWWTPVWESPGRSPARLGTTHLASTDPAYSRRSLHRRPRRRARRARGRAALRLAERDRARARRVETRRDGDDPRRRPAERGRPRALPVARGARAPGHGRGPILKNGGHGLVVVGRARAASWAGSCSRGGCSSPRCG